MVREHEKEERPFDPEKRGTWRGSSRELVVNGPPRDGWWSPVSDIELRFEGGSPNRIWVGDEDFLLVPRHVADVLTKYGVKIVGKWEDVEDGWEAELEHSGQNLVLNPNQFHKDLRELVDASKLADPDEAFEKAKAILKGGDENQVMDELNELLDFHGVGAFPSQKLPHPDFLFLEAG
ncbi:MAG TPA: hypothetical protein VGB13_11000, partial [Candidatus Krumholzibacteria bacterium]